MIETDKASVALEVTDEGKYLLICLYLLIILYKLQ